MTLLRGVFQRLDRAGLVAGVVALDAGLEGVAGRLERFQRNRGGWRRLRGIKRQPRRGDERDTGTDETGTQDLTKQHDCAFRPGHRQRPRQFDMIRTDAAWIEI